MRRILLKGVLAALALVFPLSAQLTHIIGTIQRADGTYPSGSATITNQAFVTAGGVSVPAGSQNITIISGNIDVSLYPNTNSNPSGTSYTIAYHLSGSQAYTRKWYVPISATDVNFISIEFPPAGLVGTSAVVSPSQLTQAGATLGECLIFNGNFWEPGTCAGGPGTPAFSGITSGTNTSATMVVGSGASLSATGTGVLNANRIAGTAITSVSGTSGILLAASGTLTSGNILASNSGAAVDGGIPASSVVSTSGSYSNPLWITSLAASKLTGQANCSNVPALTGDATTTGGGCAVTVVAAGGLPFAASATTNALNASNISSGTLAAARGGAGTVSGILKADGAGNVSNATSTNVAGLWSGTCDATTFLRGDGTCTTPSGAGTVTHTVGSLTSGAVVVGNGGADIQTLSSLGTTTTLLHGNAGGSPSWSAVSLTADVTGLLPTANGGLNSSSIAFSGPSGAAKTFTLPNVSSTILTSNAAVTLAQGGTGNDFSSIAKGGLISGSGVGTVTLTTVGTDGQVLSADSASAGGVKWIAAAGGGSVTSVAVSLPIVASPSPITATGTLSCPTCVTSAASLTANRLMVGAGSQASAVLGSLGTSTTLLHGNSGGAPSWAAVDLTADVTGVLPTANGGAGAGTAPFQRLSALGVSPYTIRFTGDKIHVADFNYAAITPTSPSGSISAGTYTFTLPYNPPGLTTSGATATPFYISGGTGTAEVVIPTSGTCTVAGGTGSCTMVGTTAYSHSGAWAVTSATGGLQEALDYVAYAGVSVAELPPGTTTLHTKATWPSVGFTLTGESKSATAIARAADYAEGDLFYLNNAGCCFTEIKEMAFSNDSSSAQTASTAIHAYETAFIDIHHINIFGGPYGILFEGVGTSTIHDVGLATGTHSVAHIKLSAGPVSHNANTNVQISRGWIFADNYNRGILVTSADGLLISDLEGGGGIPWLDFAPGGTSANGFYIANTRVTGNLVDEGSACSGCYPIRIYSPTGTSSPGGIIIANNKLNGNNPGVTPYQILVQSGTGLAPSGITIENNIIGLYSIYGGIVLNGGDQISIVGNQIDCDATTNYGCISINTGSKFMLVGNKLTSSTGYAVVSGGTVTGLTISGNTLLGAGAGATYPISLDTGYGTYPTSLVLAGNGGLETTRGTTSISANTLTMPATPNFEITNAGATTTNTVTTGLCWEGRSGTFITSGGAGTFNAGSTIGNTFTTTQNVPVNYWCSGGKFWSH